MLGDVQGNITATERVDIRDNGSVDGDLSAPRIAIADGAHFRGSINMQKPSASPAEAKPGAAPVAAEEDSGATLGPRLPSLANQSGNPHQEQVGNQAIDQNPRPPVEFEQQYYLVQKASGPDARSQRMIPLTNPRRFTMMTRPCIR